MGIEASVVVASPSYRTKLLPALCALMRVCCACCRVRAVCARAQKMSRRIEPLSHSEAMSWRGLPVKAQLQAGVIARHLNVELHSLVPFLIDGFMFAIPGSSARVNLINDFMLSWR